MKAILQYNKTAVWARITIMIAAFAVTMGCTAIYAPESTTAENTVIQLYTAQLTHDDSVQTIYLDTAFVETGNYYMLYVTNAEGEILWQAEAGIPHVGWNTLFLTRIEGKDYLMQYNPVICQTNSAYSFRVFSLEPDGAEVIFAQDKVHFSTNPPGGIEYFHKRDIAPIKAFYKHLYQYLLASQLLINTDDTITSRLPENQHNLSYASYGTVSAPIVVRDYFYGSADLTIEEQIDLFVHDYTIEYGALED